MSEKSNLTKRKLFIGVVTSRVGSSNSIRNSQLIKKLKKENCDINILDFGLVFYPRQKVIKILNLIKISFRALTLLFFSKNDEIIISTNPKWLIFYPLMARKNFTLFMGDPLIGDIAKNDKKIYEVIWKKSQKLMQKIFVFSPFLFNELSKEVDRNKLFFLEREPIQNLPKMIGNGGLYLGDFSSKDRNIKPLIDAIQITNTDISFFGIGEKLQNLDKKNKCHFYDRIPFSEVKRIIKNYGFLVVLLNKSGYQVPGKIYDFINAPFKVIIIYENYLDISLLPHPNNYIYCLNNSNSISEAINGLL